MVYLITSKKQSHRRHRDVICSRSSPWFCRQGHQWYALNGEERENTQRRTSRDIRIRRDLPSPMRKLMAGARRGHSSPVSPFNITVTCNSSPHLSDTSDPSSNMFGLWIRLKREQRTQVPRQEPAGVAHSRPLQGRTQIHLLNFSCCTNQGPVLNHS